LNEEIQLRCSEIGSPALVGFIFKCGSSEESMFPQKENIAESVYASGIIKAKDQYQVFANANGLINEVFVSEGDSVERNAPILSLSNETSTLNRESAELARAFSDRQANQTRVRDLEINIELAKSRMENDSLLWVRQQRLWDQGIGTLVELEQRKLNYENAKTAYETARLRLEDLKRELEFNERSAANQLAISRTLENDLIVQSKIEGKVYSLLKEKGEMVTVQTPLAVIGSADEFLLELQIDEFDIGMIEKGQKILVTMDSYRGQTFDALVTRIYPIMDESTKSFTVEGHFVQNPPRLYPNLSLEANIIVHKKENVLTLPRSYILEDRYVITADKDTLEVELGIRDFQKAEIIQGLDENTEVLKPER
jgi:HlyD family secretion protein